MKKNSSILWGLLLVGLGVLFGLNAFDLLGDIDLFFDGWWTMIIIIPSFISLFSAKNKTLPIIGIVTGVLILLLRQEIIDFEMLSKLAVPLILVAVGASLIFKNAFSSSGHRAAFRNMQGSAGSLPEYGGVFSSQNAGFAGEIFEGAELSAVFGSLVCSAENASILSDCLINCTAIFGGIDIYLPPNVNVVVRSTSLFGGVSNKRMPELAAPGATVYVNALCLFGGVDIK